MEPKYSKEKNIDDIDFEKDYAFLVNYSNYNAELWGVVIRALKNRYDEIEGNKTIPIDIKIKAKAEIEIETLCKIMELIEGLSSIIIALTSEKNKIQDTIIDFHMNREKEKCKKLLIKEMIIF